MKKIFALLIAMLIAVPAIQAQSMDDMKKDALKAQKRETKAAMDALTKKAPKIARKEAKKFKKEGWQITPGALPLEKQFERSYVLQYEYDDEGYPKYIMAEAMSVGANYDAAKMQALELAKQNLAGQIQTEVTALIENTIANEQLPKDQAESIASTVAASKNLISQSIGRVIPVVEGYRKNNKGNYQVYLRVAYNSDAAYDAAKKAIRKELEKKGGDLHKKLDELMF